MRNLNELASSVQNLAKQYQGVIQVGEFLASLGSLDNLANEVEARVEVAKKAEVAAVAARDAAEFAHREQTHLQEQALDASRAEAEHVLAEAQKRAASIVADAERAASQATADAQREVDRLAAQMTTALAKQEQATRAVAELEAEKEQLEADIAALKARFA